MAYHGDRLEPLFSPELASQACVEMVDDGVKHMMDRAVEYTPVNENPFSSPGRPPGTLKKRWRLVEGIETGVRGASLSLTRRFENWDPIAPFVENDTRPHTISPRADRGPASVIATKKPRRMGDDPQASLAFRAWPSGLLIFARIVKHPGTTGQHMTLRAAAKTEATLHLVLQPALVRWAKRQERAAMKQ